MYIFIFKIYIYIGYIYILDINNNNIYGTRSSDRAPAICCSNTCTMLSVRTSAPGTKSEVNGASIAKRRCGALESLSCVELD